HRLARTDEISQLILMRALSVVFGGAAGLFAVWPFFEAQHRRSRRWFVVTSVVALGSALCASILQAEKSRNEERAQSMQFHETLQQFGRSFMPLKDSTVRTIFYLDG